MTVKEHEPVSTDRPSMFRTAVEAAAGALPDAPAATVEQVALAVLRVALPLHETQHAAAWKAAHERAVHFEWELEQLRAQRSESRRQRNEWVSDMHAAFAAGLESTCPADAEQRRQMSQEWIAARVVERQAVQNGGNTP